MDNKGTGDHAELTPEQKRARLDEALDRGGLSELPANRPKGLLGDTGLDYRKTDDLSPDMNAGVSQEIDAPIYFLMVILGYLLFFPVGFWLLWRRASYSLVAKLGWSAAFIAGIAWVTYRLVS